MESSLKVERDRLPEHELKYVFSSSRVHLVRQWLQSRCRPDPEFPAGIVCSIYYDTRDWRSLREKLNSDYHKTKVRIRWYKDIDTGEFFPGSFLEAKYKIGARREKIRMKMDRPGKWFSGIRLENPELLDIPRFLWKQGVIFPGPLYPAFQVNYKRMRFIEPVTGSRLSLDYDIRVPAVNWHMLPALPSPHLLHAVFELKGTLSQLPNTLQPLISLGCRKQSFSKYSVGYEKIMRVAF